MDELTVKQERLVRMATAVVVAIVWALCAFVTFTASEAGDTVLSMTDQGATSGTPDDTEGTDKALTLAARRASLDVSLSRDVQKSAVY
jgi:FlaG/FlaF family flagellin (archaellin)